MNFIILIALVVTIAASTTTAIQNYLDLKPLLSQQNLVMHQMLSKMTPRDASNIGMDNILTCFNWYTQKQNDLTTTYNNELNQCVSVSVEAKKFLSAQSAAQRTSLEVRGHSVCAQMTNCEEFGDALDFFTCYKTVGSNNSQVLYDISAGSERLVNNITISYQRVDDTERVCTADARNIYLTSLSDSTTNLNNCLIGAWVPPSSTVAPTTEVTTTTQATTTPETTSTTESVETTEETTTTVEPTTEVTTTTQDTSTPEATSTTESVETTEATSTESPKELPQRDFPEEDVFRSFYKKRRDM